MTFLREYEKLAVENAREGLDHIRFLLRLTELELIDRNGAWSSAAFAPPALFQDMRKPLRVRFLAMWFVTSQKNGVSDLGVRQVLGLGGYETALAP